MGVVLIENAMHSWPHRLDNTALRMTVGVALGLGRSIIRSCPELHEDVEILKGVVLRAAQRIEELRPQWEQMYGNTQNYGALSVRPFPHDALSPITLPPTSLEEEEMSDEDAYQATYQAAIVPAYRLLNAAAEAVNNLEAALQTLRDLHLEVCPSPPGNLT